MKSTIALVLAALCTGTSAAQLTGRLFFDHAGNGGDQNAAHPGGLAMTNPAVGPGRGRLYIYWQFGVAGPNPSQNILELNYNITTDSGTLTSAMNYQCDNAAGLGVRWQDVPGSPAPNPEINPGGNTVRFGAFNINAFGLKNDTAHRNFDQGYNAASNTTILGYVDVDAPGLTAVWITVESPGISPLDEIYLGFGDEPLFPGIPNMRSRLPETFVPEPATLTMLSLAALIAGRPRRGAVQSFNRPTP